MKNKIKNKKIENSNIIFKKTLNPSYNEPMVKENPSYMLSIKRKKSQNNFWIFNGIYIRKLYSRLKETYIKRALPKVK